MTAGLVVSQGDPEFIVPGSDAWRMLVTPSKVAAMLGESRYESPFRLWHRMKGILPPEPPKDAFDIGHDVEPFAANRWRRLNPGWRISKGEVQFHVTDGHFPFPALGTIDRRCSRGWWRKIAEFKLARTLSDAEAWGDPDLSGDCPSDYACQIVTQMAFAQATDPAGGWTREPADLLAIGPYFNERLYRIEFDVDVWAWMLGEITAFYESLAHDVPPELDDRRQTFEALKQLHPDIDGTDATIPASLAADYITAVDNDKAAAKALVGAKNRMLDAMGQSKYAVVKRGNGTAIRVAERRDNGKGGVSFYSAKASLEEIRYEGNL